VPKHDEISLTTALDAGAAGIVIPHVESADEVRKFVKEMYYRKRQLSFWTSGPPFFPLTLADDGPTWL